MYFSKRSVHSVESGVQNKSGALVGGQVRNSGVLDHDGGSGNGVLGCILEIEGTGF